jgi:phenylpropionate dioxygenase-like ring-hydroxylating dioxygenase large terminal subunit
MATTDRVVSKNDLEGRPLTEAERQYPLEPHLLDARQYNDPDQYRREIEQIFFRSWFPVCPSADIAAARDYFVWDRLEQSVVIVRQDDQTLRAWHNVCQHRGARLLESSGSCPRGRFTCPWHGFAYDLAGEVTTVPLRDSFAPEQLEGLHAPGVRVEEWSGFVWLAFDQDLPDLRTYLGVIGQELDGYGLDGFTTKFRQSIELGANWKLVVDAFNETWHVPFTHKDTLTGIIMWRDAILHIESPHSWMTLPVRGFTEKRAGESDHRKSHVCHYLAFPNTIFSCFPTHLQMWSVWPLSPTRSVLQAWGVVGPTPAGMEEQKWLRQNDRDWKQFLAVTTEDSGVINGFGTVSRSLGFTRNMFNTAESRLTAFHSEVSARVGGYPVTETPR